MAATDGCVESANAERNGPLRLIRDSLSGKEIDLDQGGSSRIVGSGLGHDCVVAGRQANDAGGILRCGGEVMADWRGGRGQPFAAGLFLDMRKVSMKIKAPRIPRTSVPAMIWAQ